MYKSVEPGGHVNYSLPSESRGEHTSRISLAWNILEMNAKAHLGTGMISCQGHCLLGFAGSL